MCAILFGVSLWIISSPSTLSAAIQGFGTPTVKALLSPPTLSLQLGVALAALSTFFFFVAFMGFYGAIVRSQFLLFMYSTLVLLLLLLECALFYYFSSSLMEKGLRQEDGQWTHTLRIAFECCEYNATSLPEVVKPPWSCCGSASYPDNCTASTIYNKNCNVTIASWLHRYKNAIYASLAVLHILLSSCSLFRRVRTPTPPRKRSWHVARVAPGIEPGTDDVLMVVLGRGRIGWADDKT
ncbi:tetraspanin-13-like [Pectinophora gossypiella]|uniref:tetraspanin-13-like n=1 Tax=Pectinophora gossypiella TaxID=13191 RepID=UPI00214E8462|nr:tetraspanin-13-like [Pectinophora gossypiella]